MGLLSLFKKKKKDIDNETQQNTDTKSKEKNNYMISNDENQDSGKIVIVTKTLPTDVVSAEERIKKISPNSYGTYPHEVALLNYAPTFYVDQTSYQNFWIYKYGINDVTKVLSELKNRGFITNGTLEEAIKKETIPTLKEVLRKNNLKLSGKKSELVNRLLENVSSDELENEFTKFTYALTEKGENAVKDNEYVMYIHRNTIENLDVWKLTQMMQEHPQHNYRDLIWGYLNEKCMRHIQNDEFGLYRNCRLSMSNFVAEEGKYKNALFLLSEVIRYDLSGLSNGFDLKYLEIYYESFFPYDSSIVTIPPGVLNLLKCYSNQLMLNELELEANLKENLGKISLPFSLFSVDDCVEIALMELGNNKAGLREKYKTVQKRFKSKYMK